jgi:hypothetical protein
MSLTFWPAFTLTTSSSIKSLVSTYQALVSATLIAQIPGPPSAG